MKKYTNLAIFLVVFVATVITVLCLTYNYNIGPVSKKTDNVDFVVEKGSTYTSLAASLKEKNLIKSELFYKFYLKIFKPTKLEAGPYTLNESMGVKKIVEVLSSGNSYNPDNINITFKEGINMREVARIIAKNTNNKESDVFNLLKDSNYLDSLISTYWFLDESIKNKNIYYSLEGYLFPNTYSFMNKEVTVKEIFKSMLDITNQKLTPLKEKIGKTKYSVHQLLTLASIVELEAAHSSDRSGVAGVFYNRLNDGWSLGSDVTTYYAAKVEMSDRDLYQSEIDAYNAYNTRNSKMAGKLPVGPICNPGIEAIEASISPTDHNYYYFVADKNKKTYFNKTYSEHDKTIAKLKNEGLWYEY